MFFHTKTERNQLYDMVWDFQKNRRQQKSMGIDKFAHFTPLKISAKVTKLFPIFLIVM